MNCNCGRGMVKNGFNKGRQRWRCKACNDSFQEGNLRPRVTEIEAKSMQILVSKGVTFTAIAEDFPYTRQTVANIIKKKIVH